MKGWVGHRVRARGNDPGEIISVFFIRLVFSFFLFTFVGGYLFGADFTIGYIIPL